MSARRYVVRMAGMARLVVALLAAALAVGSLGALSAGPAGAASGGPVVLMGIDAEDGGPGGHGPNGVYQDVVNNTLSQATNGGSGILVVGGGKNQFDNVTQFWNAVDAGTPESVTYVNGAANIQAQSFSGFKMIAVVSDESNTPSGGLTQAENDDLAARQPDIAAFVNGGGALLGFSSSGFANPYAYLGGVGAFSFGFPPQYSDVTPTAEGLAVGITDDLDVCCWHDEYTAFPSFLKVLATNAATGNAAAVGGANVVVAPLEKEVPVDVKPTSCRNPLNAGERGVVPAAVLGTEDLDVTQIDPASVKLEGVSPARTGLEDVATPFEPYTGKKDAFDCTTARADGFQDLTLKFNAPELVGALGPITDGEVRVLKLTGKLKDEFGGTPIVGEDVVVTLKK
ncbi:MAG: hypothetical protein M3R38_09545 [Actinomycetota bacterium]|nr:hypothetical protein [Actinomycetota bacterium]